MKLTFIGLGNMGLPMANNLVKAGYNVIGYNRSKGAEQRFLEEGGSTAASLAEAAAEADIIMTCLPMPRDVLDVYLGSNGIIEHAKHGALLIDFSTVSPEVNRKTAQAANEKGLRFLDAPVSGGTVGAAAATLSIMVGGSKQDYDEAQPVLRRLGSNIYYVGETGSGTVVKLVNQLMVGIHSQAASEALLLGERLGVKQELLFSILDNSFAQSRIMDRHYSQFITKDSYTAGFAIKLLHKDVQLAKEMAAEHHISIPLGEEIFHILSAAEASGLADKDMSAIYVHHKNNQLLHHKGE